MTASSAVTLQRARKSCDVAFDIKTDFGAVGDGVADDSPAFGACLDAVSVLTNKVLVKYPEGKYWTPGFGYLYPWDSNPAVLNWVRNITAQATSAELTHTSLYIAGVGHPQDNSRSGFFNTNDIGDTSVTLKTIADASKFHVGNPVCVTGLTLQYSSYPANFWVQEWKRITGVDTDTGVITLDSPLKYAYKDTWPTYTVTGIDCGAACLIQYFDGNDMKLVINGFKFDATSQIYAGVQDLSYYNLTVTGEGTIMTGNKNYLANGCNFTNPSTVFEVDKMCENIRVINCYFAGSVICQSGDENMYMYGTTIAGDLTGTLKNTVIDNCHMNALIHGLAYGGFGYSENVTVTNSYFDYTDNHSPNYLLSDWSFSDGVFSRPNIPIWDPDTSTFSSGGPMTFGVPGAKLYLWISGAETIYPPAFRVTDVTQDATTTYVHTTLSAIPTFTGETGFPGQPSVFGPWGCENLSVTNCTGIAGTELSNANNVGKKPGEYSNKTYSGTLGGREVLQGRIWGTLVSFKVNVIRPYTGAQSDCFLYCNGRYGSYVCTPEFYVYAWAIKIDCKVAGLRTVTPGSITGDQPNDVIGAIGADWFCGKTGVVTEADLSGDPDSATPIVNIEIITSQE